MSNNSCCTSSPSLEELAVLGRRDVSSCFCAVTLKLSWPIDCCSTPNNSADFLMANKSERNNGCTFVDTCEFTVCNPSSSCLIRSLIDLILSCNCSVLARMNLVDEPLAKIAVVHPQRRTCFLCRQLEHHLGIFPHNLACSRIGKEKRDRTKEHSQICLIT